MLVVCVSYGIGMTCRYCGVIRVSLVESEGEVLNVCHG